MNLNAFWTTARQKLPWLAGLIAVFLVGGLFWYAGLSDKFEVKAVITSKTSENQSFDAGSLGGLAALAGGGQRPVFEQVAFLIQSEAAIRRILPDLRRTAPRLVNELLGRSAFQQFRIGLEDTARATFGKPQKIIAIDDRLVDSIAAHLKITKTPEGYVQVSFTAGTADGEVRLVQGLLREADAMIRARERIEYRRRIDTYQDLILQRIRPTEKLVLTNLIGREYSNFVTAQSGETFSYAYVEPVVLPKRIYSSGIIVVLIVSIMAALLSFVAYTIGVLWIRKT